MALSGGLLASSPDACTASSKGRKGAGFATVAPPLLLAVSGLSEASAGSVVLALSAVCFWSSSADRRTDVLPAWTTCVMGSCSSYAVCQECMSKCTQQWRVDKIACAPARPRRHRDES